MKPKVLREFSSGGVVFKRENNEILWLVAKNAPSKLFPHEIWRLPKGWIDDRDGGKNPGPISSGEIKASEDVLVNGALREVREEGGVITNVVKKIGTSKYFTNSSRGKVLKFVTFYLMEYREDAPEGFDEETSEVLWLPFEDAKKKLTRTNEKEMLVKASLLLD